MGQFHICWQRNFIYYKHLQTDRPQDSIPHKEHQRKPTHTQKLPRHSDSYLELTNIPALIVIRLTSGKLADDFPQGTKSTKLPSVTITKHTTLRNTSMMQRTPSALWMKSCKYYTAPEKDSTWIRSKDFTSTRNQYTIITWMMTTPSFRMLFLTPY